MPADRSGQVQPADRRQRPTDRLERRRRRHHRRARPLNTGTHTVGETAGAGTTWSSYRSRSVPHTANGEGCAGRPRATRRPAERRASPDGADIVCTITNTRKKGTVKLVKDIVPVDEQLGDPGKFDLTIDGQGSYGATKSDAGDGDSVTATVPTGDVDLCEAAGTNTSLSDYTSTYSCSAPGHTDVTGSGTSIAISRSPAATRGSARSRTRVRRARSSWSRTSSRSTSSSATRASSTSRSTAKAATAPPRATPATATPSRRRPTGRRRPQRGRGHEHQPVRLHEHVQLLTMRRVTRTPAPARAIANLDGRQRRLVGLHDHEHA